MRNKKPTNQTTTKPTTKHGADLHILIDHLDRRTLERVAYETGLETLSAAVRYLIRKHASQQPSDTIQT